MMRLLFLALVAGLLGRMAVADTPPAAASTFDAASAQDIVLAVDNPLRAVPQRAGSSLPGYRRVPAYTVSSAAATALAALEQDYHLQRVAAWPIAALGWHCVVYRPPGNADQATLLKALAADPRVRLVQPLQRFETLSGASETPRYNDPYLSLQRGFIETDAAQAHRVSTGRDVPVAVVDTGVDLHHPDLQGRVAASRDLVADTASPLFPAELHGTEIAGVIAAVGNNRQGIVGIAPGVQLNVYRACWYPSAGTAARCNSFTLAKALSAVLDSDARIINLSLGGPADPLLEALLRKLLAQHRIVIGALPPSGVRQGFPTGMPGVIAVACVEDLHSAGADVLAAPGRDVLTLVPDGHYDFASGSSIAAAHATGIAALLLALDPRLDGPAMQALLASTATSDHPSINAAAAVAALAQQLRHLATTAR